MVTSIPAHENDINSVCYLGPDSPVILSGSDDSNIHLYDPRALGINKSPVSIFLGHYGGLTCVSSKEDGIYFCSNSKDQTLKIWDTRHPSPSTAFNKYILDYDYRFEKLSDS